MRIAITAQSYYPWPSGSSVVPDEVCSPIKLEDYVEQHLLANPGERREDVVGQLEYAIGAQRRGVRCDCGKSLWIIGSSVVGLGCFTCITGEAEPDGDFEIEIE